jgi:hypothetical protein
MPPSFTITNDSNRRLRPSIEAATRVADAGVITVGPDALRIRGINSGNNILADIRIDGDGFDTFDTTPGDLHLDFEALHSAIREVNKTSAITIVADPDTESVTISDPDTGDAIDTIPYIDPETARTIPDRPDLTWETEVTTPGGQFNRLTRAANKLSGHLTFAITNRSPGCDEYVFQAYAAGDTDDLYGYPDHDIITQPHDPLTGRYKLEFLRQMSLAVDRPASTTVTFAFAGTDFPLRCEFSIEDDAATSVSYILAPRIDADTQETPEFERWAAGDCHLENATLDTTTDGAAATTLFDSINAITDEYRVLATPSGIESRSIDTTNVCQHAVTVADEYFDTYTADPALQSHPFGLTDQVTEYLTLWRNRDPFELHYDPGSDRLELVHDQFRIRAATIDPTKIRTTTEFPEYELTGRAAIDLNALTDRVESTPAATGHVIGITDDAVHTMPESDDDDPEATALPADWTAGRAVSTVPSDYLKQAIQAAPSPDDGHIIVTSSIESPTTLRVSFGDGAGTAVTLIAPRVDDNVGERLNATTPSPIDYSWSETETTGEKSFSLVSAMPNESIMDRVETHRYQTYPVKTTITLPRHRDDDDHPYRIEHADKLTTPTNTLTEIRDTVADTYDPEILTADQPVAELTIQSDTQYSIEYGDVEVDTAQRVTTTDGHRLRQTASRDDHYSYHSNRTETPARQQLVMAARAADATNGVAVMAAAKPPDEPDVDEFTPIETGFDSMAAAYQALVDYIQSHDLRTLLTDAGIEPTASVRDVTNSLSELLEPYAGWEPRSVHGQPAFFTVLATEGRLTPDATYTAEIIVEQPDSPTDPYVVRYVVSMVATGPGDAADRDELAADAVGAASDRRNISSLVELAFDAIASFGDWYVTTDPPADPVHEPPNEADDGWMNWYLPLPKSELIAELAGDDTNVPLELTEVDQIGPSRADPFTEAGVTNLIDLASYAAGPTHNRYTRLIDELPTTAQSNLDAILETIWQDYIWPARELPGAYVPPTPSRLITPTAASSADARSDPESPPTTDEPQHATISPRHDAALTTPPGPIKATVHAVQVPNGVSYVVTTPSDVTLSRDLETDITRHVEAAAPSFTCDGARRVATVTITDRQDPIFDVDLASDLTTPRENGLYLSSV